MNKKYTSLKKCCRLLLSLATLLMFAGVFSAQVFAQTQDTGDAGSVFGNQATTTFRDGSGAVRTVTSNIVTSTVIQVAASTIKSDQSKFVGSGGQVYYQHVITNDGNGPDSFTLSTGETGDFSFANVYIYADINGDGIPDDNVNLTSTPQLDRNETFRFVVVGYVPAGVNADDENTITVTATSAFDSNHSSTVTDITTISDNAVINVIKSLDRNEGPIGQQVTVTLRYTNTGNSAASNLSITDDLPDGMTYVPNSARWSVTGSSTALTDADQVTQGSGTQTIIYDYNETAPGTITAVVNEVNAGQSGILSFDVTIGDASGQVENVADYSYNDGTGATAPRSTNTVAFTVDKSAAIVGTGDTVASAPQGGTIDFENTITNNGNSTDIFEVEIGTDDFPSGTTFFLLKESKGTPLLDSNNNGTPDTGPVAAGESYTIILRAVLPGNATGGPFQVEKTVTSSNDESQSVTLTDQLTSILTSDVDLTLDAATGQPSAIDGGVYQAGQPAVQSKNLDGGKTVSFEVYVNNTSSAPDNYDLKASTVEDFSSLQIPANWDVVFKDAAGRIITNTGNIVAGGSTQVFLEVTVKGDTDALPDGQDFYIRALSPVSGTSDRLHVEVVVNTSRALNVNPNNSGQIYPGGSVGYMHTISNNGNVDEQNISLSASNSASGYSSVIYEDINDNGILDDADQVITSIATLAKGATQTVFVKVTAPEGAANGATNVTTLTVTPDNAVVNGIAAPAAATATDLSTVVNSNVVIAKSQSKVSGGPYAATSIEAAPGDIIYYQIEVTNQGTESVTEVIIEDDTPAYTSYVGSSATVSGGSINTVDVEPADEGTGLVKVTVGVLDAGESAVLIFAVKVD